MIFPDLKTEAIVQVNDKTRIDATMSFSQDEDITKIEICPDGTDVFFDVTSKKYLDWQYSTSGNKSVTLRMNDYKEISQSISIISVEEDNLYSSDEDLVQCEPEVLGFLPSGKNSYNNIHREVKKRIMQRLNEKEIWDIDNNKLTDAAIMDLEEIREWSKYYAMELIFYGLSNTVDDLYQLKGEDYRALRGKAEDRSMLRLDIDGDGKQDGFTRMSVGHLNRR